MKSKERNLLISNFLMNGILTLSSVIFPLVTFPYISRVLSPVGLGKVSFATSVATYFSMIAQLGIPTYGIRMCAQVRDDKQQLSKTVQELFLINMVMCCVSYLFFVMLLIFVPRLHSEIKLNIIISFTVIFNLFGMEWLYKALEKYKYITIRSVIFKLIALIAMFLMVKNQEDYVVYGGISIFAASASNILNFINVKKYISFARQDHYDLKRHLKPIIVFFGMSVATTIYTQLDSVMLGFMSSDTEVGYYHAAVKIKTVLVSFVASLGTVLLPRASYYIKQGMIEKYNNITEKALNYVLVVSVPLMIYFTVYAREGIYFLSGSQYEASVLPMQIIMPTLVFITFTSITGTQMLVPVNREKCVLVSEIVGAVVNLICNALLIPRYASAGAAVGTVIAEFVVLGVQVFYLGDRIWLILRRTQHWKIFVAIIGSMSISFCVGEFISNIFYKLCATAIVYFGLYVGILYILKENFTKDILQKMLCSRRTKS